MKQVELNPDAMAMIVAALEKERDCAQWRATLTKYGEAWVKEHQAQAVKYQTLLDYLNS